MGRHLSLFDALKATVPRTRAAVSMVNAGPLRGWSTLFDSMNEHEPGDFQRNIHHLPRARQLAFFAVYACITQIANDISKLCVYLKEKQASGVWLETDNTAYSPFLRKPNHYQTMQQFVDVWIVSKLSRGNTVALKERDASNKVRAQYVLDWDRVQVLIAPDGSVLYELRMDDLSHLYGPTVSVPASEIIHDRMSCLFHPLIGVSPLFASGLAAAQGLEMQKNSATFFANMSRPSGVLTGPGFINDETAERLKKEWEGNFGKGKIGRTAVLGDGLAYSPMSVTPDDAKIVEQLELSAQQVCSTFKVPPFMIGVGEMPRSDNVQELTLWYYSACLQTHVQAFENLQADGLSLPPGKLCLEFDLDDLLRMDTKTATEVEGNLVKAGIKGPNEARARFDLAPVKGGATPYLQQQNYSLAALDKRDTGSDPFKTAPAPAAPPAAPPADDSQARAALAAAEAEAVRLRAEVERLQRESEEERRQAAERADAQMRDVKLERERIQREREAEQAAARARQESDDLLRAIQEGAKALIRG